VGKSSASPLSQIASDRRANLSVEQVCEYGRSLEGLEEVINTNAVQIRGRLSLSSFLSQGRDLITD
jgi:hypothetical protein